jgi:hypothetical protein
VTSQQFILNNLILDWLFYYPIFFLIQKKNIIMKNDEKRSHRLNYLLKCYLMDPEENELYRRAKQMGVTDFTAKDYIRTVIIQAQKTLSK